MASHSFENNLHRLGEHCHKQLGVTQMKPLVEYLRELLFGTKKCCFLIPSVFRMMATLHNIQRELQEVFINLIAGRVATVVPTR
jgi:hypothetical protein